MKKLAKQLLKPFNEIQDYNNTYKPLEQEVGNFLRLNTETPLLYSNDLRHRYASAVFTQKYGKNKAKFLGDLNEILDFGLSGKNDTENDKIQNAIGRNYGLKYPQYSKDELIKKIFEDMR